MLLIVIRCLFLLTLAGLAARIAGLVPAPGESAEGLDTLVRPELAFLAIMIVGVIVLLLDVFTPGKRIQTISAVYFGLIVGLVLSYLFQIALEPTLSQSIDSEMAQAIAGLLTVIICYVCISTLLQTKNDFRFVIPYIEFSREVKGLRPLILDTSVIIDGRIADVAETRILDAPLLVPRFVLQELQSIADSADKLRRNRGRRGLDILNRLQKMTGIEIQVHDADLGELRDIREVDQRLVVLAKHVGGKVVTNDYNLNKIARLQDVEVINLNDLANSLKPVFLPGEHLNVKLIRRGEESGQGVGYLDDGTMVVTEQGANHLGETVRVTVTSVLQTSAGRMIFGRFDHHGHHGHNTRSHR